MYVVALHNNSTGKGETPFDTPFNLSKTHFKNTSSDCIFKSSFFYKLLRVYRHSQTLTLFAFIKLWGIYMYNKKLIFRLDEEVEARLKLRSAELGISYAEYIRELINKELISNNLDTIYSFMLKLDKVYNELHRIGINLNQAVKKMNSKSVKNEVLNFEDIVISYCEEIAEVLEDFGGIENAIDYENRRRKENE